jgi:hypothetical protein
MADDQWGHSKVHRVNLLVDRIKARIAHGHKIRPPELVGAMMGAATADLRGEKLLPLALKVVGNDPKAKGALSILRSWVRAGAHRLDRKRTGHYAHQAAVALFDTWWDDNGLGHGGLSKAVLRPVLGARADAVPQRIDDHPRQGLGSSWDSVASYGYVSRILRSVLGEHVKGAYSQRYCGTLAHCRSVLRRSLHVAIKRSFKAQKVSSVRKLTYDKSLDDIVSATAGVVGVRPIDWQNRPTFQQVVNYRHHRAGKHFPGRFGPGAAIAPTGGSTGRDGLPGWLPALALALLVGLVPFARRRWRPVPVVLGA